MSLTSARKSRHMRIRNLPFSISLNVGQLVSRCQLFVPLAQLWAIALGSPLRCVVALAKWDVKKLILLDRARGRFQQGRRARASIRLSSFARGASGSDSSGVYPLNSPFLPIRNTSGLQNLHRCAGTQTNRNAPSNPHIRLNKNCRKTFLITF